MKRLWIGSSRALARPASAVVVIVLGTLGLRTAGWAQSESFSNFYVTESGRNDIVRLQRDGTVADILVDGSNGFHPISLSIDQEHGWIYFFERAENWIRRARLDGSGDEVLLDLPGRYVRNIAIDSDAGRIYYATSANGDWSVESANLDGTGVSTEIGFGQGLGWAYDIAINLDGERAVYIPDDEAWAIRRYDLDSQQHAIFLEYPELPRKPRTVAAGGGNIYVTRSDGIAYAPLNDPTAVEPFVVDGAFPIHMSIDLANQKIYWTARHVIKRADLQMPQGETWETRDDVETILTTADWLIDEHAWFVASGGNGRIYFVVPNGSTIFSAPIADPATDIQVVMSRNNRLLYPRRIALDLDSGKMYWTETGVTGWGDPAEETYTEARVQRANLDGSDIEDLATDHEHGVLGALGIALDVQENHVYFGDFNRFDSGPTGTIQRVNLQTGGVEVVVPGLGRPRGVTLHDGRLYWVDYHAATTRVEWANTVDLPLAGREQANILFDASDQLVKPDSIAIDSVAQQMYITDFGHTPPTIFRGPVADGALEVFLDADSPELPPGMTIGSPKDLKVIAENGNVYVYWVDSLELTLNRARTDRTEIAQVDLDSAGYVFSSPRGFALDYVNTLTGTGGTVTVEFVEETTRTPSVEVTFTEDVTIAGTTTMVERTTGPAPPSGFRLGDSSIYYDIDTSATFSGDIQICIHYDDADYPGPEADLKLYHYVDGSGWVDTQGAPDEENNTICGTVSSLSPFAIFQPIDTDGDGLSDLEELARGTSPDDPDSDDDGLTDGEEVLDIGTDPLDDDSDDDGLTDGEEIDLQEFGTCPNPLVTDSDGDGLSDGLEYMTGLSPCDADGDDDGLPDGLEGAYGYGTDPHDPDSDDDGLLDGAEVDSAMGTGCPSPTTADSDGDTWSDGYEVLVEATDPCNPDTDGDGLDDNEDPTPLAPGVPGDWLEEAIRDTAAAVAALDLEYDMIGPNDNAKKGRRNSLANRLRNAANRIRDGHPESAVALLESVLAKMDGEEPPKDWVVANGVTIPIADDVELFMALVDLL